MTPVYFLKNREGDDRSLKSWATFVWKGNPVMNEAWEAFKTMQPNEGVVVYLTDPTPTGGDEPVKWYRVISTDGYGYELEK